MGQHAENETEDDVFIVNNMCVLTKKSIQGGMCVFNQISQIVLSDCVNMGW